MVPKNFANAGPSPLGTGSACPLEKLPHTCYQTKFRRSNCMGVIKEIHRVILTPRVPPFTVIRGHWNRQSDTDRSAAYDFLLVFHSNMHGPISYRFRNKRRFLLKIANYSNPSVFNVPANFVTAIRQKLKCPMVSYNTRVLLKDGHDGRICQNNILLYSRGMLTRVKSDCSQWSGHWMVMLNAVFLTGGWSLPILHKTVMKLNVIANG